MGSFKKQRGGLTGVSRRTPASTSTAPNPSVLDTMVHIRLDVEKKCSTVKNIIDC